jgi:3-oxoacyl-[acyl-carrier-protein] synthase II
MIADLKIEPDESRVMAILRRLLAPLAGKLDPLTPIILATTVGEIEHVEQALLRRDAALAQAAGPDALLKKIKDLLGLRGPGTVLSAACASSAAAVACAAAMIRGGEAPAVLVVGADAISEFVYSGFSSLLSLSERPARPFDAQRDGLSLGEAAAWALLSDADAPAATNATTEILGWGSTTDAVHMTAPDRNGLGLSRAIRKACQPCGRSPAQVAMIAAHGTGTVYSDAMEMVAFHDVFPQPRPTFSVKGGMGHTLGAAGLTQLLVTQQAMSSGLVPPSVGLTAPFPQANGWVSDRACKLAAGGLAVSTHSGFGGINTVVLLGPRTTP